MRKILNGVRGKTVLDTLVDPKSNACHNMEGNLSIICLSAHLIIHVLCDHLWLYFAKMTVFNDFKSRKT